MSVLGSICGLELFPHNNDDARSKSLQIYHTIRYPMTGDHIKNFISHIQHKYGAAYRVEQKTLDI